MTEGEPAVSAAAGLRQAYAAAHAQFGLVVVLFALAGLGWWWTIEQMHGMDNGPWTDLGTFSWFLSAWVVMMAAMMFPSVAPTVALYSRMNANSRMAPLVFSAGYLLTWAGAGVIAYAIGVVGSRVIPGLVWEHAGRLWTGSTLILAAVYEFTPLKNVCLGKCRSPLGLLLSSWRRGWSGALRMGGRNGLWCVGCCWALMASLFALGAMSTTWMAIIAGIIAMEKLLPSRRAATYGTAAILLVLGVLVLAAPEAVPALTVPGRQPM